MINKSSLWRDVFQNYKDTRLLIDAVKSSTAVHHASTKEVPADLLKSIQCIQKFITFHTSNYQLEKCNWNKRDIRERNISVKRRLHAVLFFNLLKSLKITSLEADAYFETVQLESCNIVWYSDLLCHLHWHECFVQCAKQLPDEVMLYVCEQFLTMAKEQRSFHLYYAITQSIIWKLFMHEDPQMAAYENSLPKFSFPFALPEVVTDENNAPTQEKLFKLFEHLLLDVLSWTDQDLPKYPFEKLFLHTLKLILKLLVSVKFSDGSFINKLFHFIASHFKLVSYCETDVEPYCECEVQDSVYREESAGITMEYLILVMCAYCDAAEELITHVKSRFSEVFSELECLLTKIKEFRKYNCGMYEHFENNQNITKLLKAVIQNDYPCSFKAAEIVLKEPKVINSSKFIEVLINNKEVLATEKNLTLLLNAAFLEEEDKEPLVLLLFSVLSSVPEALYYNILNYRITKFGCLAELKHPAFSEQIDLFGRKTVAYKKAEKLILPLLVQSPSEVLSTIVAQALDQGKEGMDLIKVLTNVTGLICSTKTNLLTEIAFYLSSEEESNMKKLKNMPLIVETVVMNSPENTFEKYMEICVLPYLDNTNRLEVILNCLNVALQNLKTDENRSLDCQSIKTYLKKCGAILNDCIVSHKSKIKEQVLEGMSLMIKLFPNDCTLSDEAVFQIQSCFEVYSYSPSVLVYMKNFLRYSLKDVQQNTSKLIQSTSELSELATIWTWCCYTRDEDQFQKCISETKFSHEILLKVLTSVFLHFTLEEWIQSSLFIKENCKHLHSFLASSQKPWKLNESNFQLYATVKCLIDCVSSILTKYNDVSAYVCSNFTNTVMKILDDKDTQPELFLYIFMDMCVLSKVEDFWKTFSSFMITILKQTYQHSKDKAQKKVFQTLFTNILKHLPESEDKLAILQAI